MEKTNGVILLVYGIPAAGKTRLSTNLCKESQKYDNETFIALHFDDFYPPDLRTEQQCTTSARDVKGLDDKHNEPLFKLKDTRKEINDNVEHLIRINGLGSSGANPSPTGSQESWIGFLHQISSCNSHVTFNDHGRIQGRQPIVLLLDDNMIYHSIRYEYYQMARRYSLGFGEVLVSCTPQLAMSRNSSRSTPLPVHTIKNMADDLESTQPDKFHWEHNSITIDTLAVDNAWDRVLPLVQYAIAHPVLQLEDNSEQAMADRQQTLDNIIHQADQVLRKCVSKKITAFKGNPEISAVAKSANIARRKVLEEIKSNGLCLPVSSSNQQLTMDSNFITIVETQFSLKYHISK